MTYGASLSASPQITIRRTDAGFVLQSERSSCLSAFFKGKSIGTVQTLLTSLMGLCPVAHHEAFRVATTGVADCQSTSLLAVEAMLESVRVFCVDWQVYADDVHVHKGVLEELGLLRQRLFEVLPTREASAVQRLLRDTQDFVRRFQDEYPLLLSVLLRRSGVFSDLSGLSVNYLLSHEQLKESQTIRYCLSQLAYDRDFAVKPHVNGVRIVGALARNWQAPGMASHWKIASILVARWVELSVWSYSDEAIEKTFTPSVHVSIDGWQVGLTETVRGTLLHAVKVEGDILRDFHVIAPTEWVFQPKGLLMRLMDEFVANSRELDARKKDDLKYLVALFDACTDIKILLGEDDA